VDQPAVTLTETHSPTHATVTASAAGGGTTLETTNALDYAGLLWTHLQIQGSGPLSVSDLTLEVPLKAAAATLMQTSYGWEDAGAVKAWNNQVGPGMQLWLGNDDGGLQVSLPSAQYWRGGDRDRQVEIEPHGDQVILRLRLVQGRVSFAESAIDYQVGFQVTPVRAPPAGWRLWRFAPIPAPGTPGRWFAPFYTNSWDEGVSYPVPRREAWLKRFTDAAAQGSQPVLYMQPFTASPAMPDYADYAAEWRKKLGVPAPPADPNANPEAEDRLCPREGSWSDYFVATFFSLMDGASKDVPWGGVYFDNDDVPICDDGDHGCGWVDENGVRQPERRWLEASALHKRFYVAMQQLHPDKLIFSHCSGHPDMSLLGFCDAMIDGEQLGPAMPAHNWNYHDILTLDRMRAEFMGSNYGHVAIFLPELAQPVYLHMGQGGEELRDHFNLEPEPAEEMQVIGLVMAHDILPWPLYETLTPFYHLWAVEDAFGWGDDVEFLPYWKNQTLVTVAPADPNVVCSLYRKAGKLMAVVVNNTGADRDVTLQFHADALNLPALAQADHMLDAWTGASFAFHAYQHDVHGVPRPQPDWQTQAGQETRVPMTGGQVTVHVPAWGFRLLVTPQ
jgi:hypothetical protein